MFAVGGDDVRSTVSKVRRVCLLRRAFRSRLDGMVIAMFSGNEESVELS
jgi:hypothetical protein